MKLERVTDPLSLGQFFKAHCPDSFYVKRCSDGYGCWYELRLSGTPIFGIALTWTCIATIYSNQIELHHPTYLEDVRRVVEQFEGLGGADVTLRYADECPVEPEPMELPGAARKIES